MKRLIRCSAFVAVSVMGASTLFAHGGGHRIPHSGPAGTVTQNPFQGQPTTTPVNPSPVNPTPNTPQPPSASPTPTPVPTPGATRPTRPTGAGAGAGSVVTRRTKGSGGRSFEDWNFWWHFNKEPYLELKSSLYQSRRESESSGFFLGRRIRGGASDVARPSAAFIRANLIPTLVEALDDSHPDVVDSACVALGKVGGALEVPVLTKMLRHRNASVRKSAVIALGLLECREAVPALLAVLEAKAAGARLRGGREPEFAMRAMAATSLGIVQGFHATDKGDRIRDALVTLSESDENKNIRVNATVALGLLRGDAQYIGPVKSQLMKLTNKRRFDDFVRAHALVAFGRLVKRNALQVDDAMTAFLTRAAKRARSAHVARSAVLTLGTIFEGRGDSAASIVKLLKSRALGKGKGGNMARYWASIALGQIGGDMASKTLRSIVRTEKSQKGAFAALGLGILIDKTGEDRASDVRARNLSALRTGFANAGNPRVKSGFAIAIGIARDYESGAALLRTMKKTKDVDLRGYVAVAMGMVNYTNCVDYLASVLENSKNLPFLQEQTAIALGLMGTREVTNQLVATLGKGKSTYVQSSVTKALGYIGDRETIAPLVKLLANEKKPDLTRAFACVALGSIGDDKDLPVLSGLFTNHNYFASTQSLMELSRII